MRHPNPVEFEFSVMRFIGLTISNLVLDTARKMTNVMLDVRRDPVSPSEHQRGVGDYHIVARPCRKMNLMKQNQVGRIVQMAITLVLADTVASDQPRSPLVRDIWMLRPENRDAVLSNERQYGGTFKDV